MKKVLCSLAVVFSLGLATAQISVNENFTTTPTAASGFTFVGFSGSATNPIPCSSGNRAMNKSFYSGSATNATNAIVYSSDNSNGGKLTISFLYKHPPGTVNASVNGSMKVEYAIDNGEYQLLDEVTLNKVEQFCQTYTKTIDDGVAVKSKNFKLKISGTYISGDYYLVVDDLVITQAAPTLAVNDLSKEQISVYPNPVMDVISLSDFKNVKRVSISDISGKLVKNVDNPKESINISELKKGNYILNIQTVNGQQQTQKIIKK
ncbi:T9SS type A sorting domain-containing protein [Soonwooa sp.]|uniref:T9SS type A sorting domain-containing protein n=1 Tax=Soonwooa sp. TaxID=1938592 RepID=UPI00261A37BA|nr:T9SS type A sorting domain-containing protein [Soonwooa sp.]